MHCKSNDKVSLLQQNAIKVKWYSITFKSTHYVSLYYSISAGLNANTVKVKNKCNLSNLITE